MIVKEKIKYKMAKLTTRITWVLAHGICHVWAWARSFRSKNNFDYFIKNLRTQYPTCNKAGDASVAGLPFISKLVYEDEFERSVSLKIGDICIEYSFTKTLEEEEKMLYLLDEDKPEQDVTDAVTALVHLTKQTHHNASVLQFSKHRKEQDGVEYRKDNS